MSYLELKGIKVSYDGQTIIDGLDLKVEEGSILAILGPSGCGKSTTLRVISGLATQDGGEVWLDGRRIDDLPVHKRRIGFVFQHYTLFPHMTVRKNIEFGMRMKGWSEKKMKKQLKVMLKLVGLEGMEDRKPHQLSGGQQQRVALARALAPEPKLLLLDEPFGALDAKIRRNVRRHVKRIQQETGLTMLFVTHDQEEAFEMGTNIAVMNKGAIEQNDLPRNLYDNPATPFVARFVGNMNILGLPTVGENGKVKKGAEVMVRPEDIHIVKEAPEPLKPGSNAMGGVLINYFFRGPIIEIITELDDEDIITSIMTKSDFVASGLRRSHRVTVTIGRYQPLPTKNGTKNGKRDDWKDEDQ